MGYIDRVIKGLTPLPGRVRWALIKLSYGAGRKQREEGLAPKELKLFKVLEQLSPYDRRRILAYEFTR
jgi:hypothetical protein